MKINRLATLVVGCAMLGAGIGLLYLRFHSSSQDDAAHLSVKINRTSSNRPKNKKDTFFHDGSGSVDSSGDNSSSEQKSEASARPSAPETQVSIITKTLPMGMVGFEYNQVLRAKGMTSGAVWKITKGNLPPGLEINRNGEINGIPEQEGEWSFTVSLTDQNGNQAGRILRLLISPPAAGMESEILSIVTENLAEGSLGREYIQELTPTGGEPPYAWSIIGDGLPDLIHLNKKAGVLYGVPRELGKFTFTLRLTDANDDFVEKSFFLVIEEGEIEIITAALPPAVKGEEYSLAFRAQGGVVPYRWEMVTGNLPEGMEFDWKRGIISGIPEKWETAVFVLRVTGQEGRSAEKKFKLMVVTEVQRITDLKITTDALPNAVRGELYTFGLAADNGATPYTWTVSKGDLPPSLSLDSGTGIISGVPEKAGMSTLTILVSDMTGNTAQKEYDFTVDYQLVYITTGTLETAVVGYGYEQQITATGGTPPYTFSIESGLLPEDLYLDSVSGKIMGAVADYYFGQGKQDFSFRVKATDQDGHYDIVELNMTIRETLEPTPLFSPTPEPESSPTPVPTMSPEGLHISTRSLPKGKVGISYETTLSAEGGVEPYYWSFQDLPDGFYGDDSGTISGMPEYESVYSVLVTVEDAENNVASKTFTLTISEGEVENISDLIGAAGDGKVGLAWINPDSSDFDEVKVIKKIGDYPRHSDDGMVVYEGTADNIVDQDLNNGITYFYAVIAYNEDGESGGIGDDNLIELTPQEVSLTGENDPYADEVISFNPLSEGGAGASSMPDIVLGSPRGEGKDKGSLDTVSLHARVYDGNRAGGSVILKFVDNLVWDGEGEDFTIFENVFDILGQESLRWMEPAIVAVSQDGDNYYTFPYDYVPHYDDNNEIDYYNPYSYMTSSGATRGFAGISPVFSNNGSPDPTNPSVSGGDSFDLEDLNRDLTWIQYIKITSTGDGWLTDRNGDIVRHVRDWRACSGVNNSGFDLDAVSAVNY